jgi:hypothetical protein
MRGLNNFVTDILMSKCYHKHTSIKGKYDFNTGLVKVTLIR